MTLTIPTERNISNKIEPNYSSWQQIELSYQCAKYSIDNNIQGDFVECGIACGNNLAAMCAAGREGIGFDSFQGIPWAGVNDETQPGIGKINPKKIGVLESSGVTVHRIGDVRQNFERWGVTNYRLVAGWFQNTLKDKADFPIAVLRLDGDLYDSTLVCLQALYPWLSKGGILIIDDWELAGCQKAFNDYFSEYDAPELILDNGVTYWQK